jgi:flagellar basal-body rod protein FlgF
VFQNAHVALSAQLALQRRLDTIAHNIANASTAGFRAEEVRFEQMLSSATPEHVAFASRGHTHISEKQGAIHRTGNPLDVAIDGNAWLSVATPNGIVFTRDGRLRMTETGELQSVLGYAVLDASGAPIQLDATGGPPAIARDGMITQSGTQKGAIGLFEFRTETRFERRENSGVVGDTAATPVLDFTRAGMTQASVEASNVDPVREMTQLIALHRLFDATHGVTTEADMTLQEAIKVLAGAS